MGTWLTCIRQPVKELNMTITKPDMTQSCEYFMDILYVIKVRNYVLLHFRRWYLPNMNMIPWTWETIFQRQKKKILSEEINEQNFSSPIYYLWKYYLTICTLWNQSAQFWRNGTSNLPLFFFLSKWGMKKIGVRVWGSIVDIYILKNNVFL